MIRQRRFAFALAAALVGPALCQAAELPAQNAPSKKPKHAAPTKICSIAGVTGVLTAEGVCVRFSGFVSVGVTGGQIK
jgi:hypothetical protein